MKRMTKLASLLLVVALVFSLAITVAAEGEKTGSLTIKQSVKDKTYELYKIFDLTYDYIGDEGNTEAENLRVAYTVDTDWVAFFHGDGAGYIVDTDNAEKTLSPIVVDGAIKYINITEANVEEFSTAAQNYLIGVLKENKTICDSTVIGTGSDETVTDLPLGYYLVYVPGATEWAEGRNCLCSLTITIPDGEVDIKAVYPNITKESNQTAGVDIGDEVTYTITGKIPDTTGYDSYTYTITDTMSAGLTFTAEDVTVSITGVGEDGADVLLTKDTEYTYTKTDNGFALTVKVMDLQQYVGAELTVSYSAVVNENAITQVSANTAYLTYSDRPYQEDSTANTSDQPAHADIYSSCILIDKVDAKLYETAVTDEEKAAAQRLEGAVFVLRKNVGTAEAPVYQYYRYTMPNPDADVAADVSWVTIDAGDGVVEDALAAIESGTITAATTGADGKAAFRGLKDGTYELVEVEAPDGYNLLLDPVAVEVDGSGATADNQAPLTVTTVVENASGTALPGTGGIGSTIFYVLGFAMAVTAAVLLVTKRRMRADE